MKIHVLLILLVALVGYSQEIQTFNGSFYKGTATYKYFDNDEYERVYHGSFSYQGSYWEEGWGKTKFEVKGSFENNVKNGEWEYIRESEDWKSETIGSYSNGVYDGEWTKKTVLKKTGKTFVEYALTFKNGVPVGKVEYTWTKPSTVVRKSKTLITGQYDENGMMHGTWRMNSGSVEEQNDEVIMKYIHGIRWFYLERDKSTGEIKEKVKEDTVLINSLLLNMNVDSISTVNGVNYVLYPDGNRFFRSWFISHEYYLERIRDGFIRPREEMCLDYSMTGIEKYASKHSAQMNFSSQNDKRGDGGIIYSSAMHKLYKFENPNKY